MFRKRHDTGMCKNFSQLLFWIWSVTAALFGSNGNASASLKEACPIGKQITGWGQKVLVSTGTYFKPRPTSCFSTSAVHKGGAPISASGYITNDSTHTPFQGIAPHVNNNGWKTFTEYPKDPKDLSKHLPCEMYGYVYFALTSNGTTWNDSKTKITSCTYFICTSALSCKDFECRPDACYSPHGEPTITLKPANTP